MPPLEEFEKHFSYGKTGEIIIISIQTGKVIRIRNEKRKTETTLALLVANRDLQILSLYAADVLQFLQAAKSMLNTPCMKLKRSKNKVRKNIRKEEKSIRTKRSLPTPSGG